MKRLAAFILMSAAAFGQASAPGVLSAKTVYLFPMAGGLDQYLAGGLARKHVMQVVVDPKLADAVMTDSLGDSFEQKLTAVRKDETTANDGKDGKDAKDAHNDFRPSFKSGTGRGTIFLVDARTRQVLWSGFRKAPGTPSPANMNRTAERIVQDLHNSFGQ